MRNAFTIAENKSAKQSDDDTNSRAQKTQYFHLSWSRWVFSGISFSGLYSFPFSNAPIRYLVLSGKRQTPDELIASRKFRVDTISYAFIPVALANAKCIATLSCCFRWCNRDAPTTRRWLGKARDTRHGAEWNLNVLVRFPFPGRKGKRRGEVVAKSSN